MAPFVFNIYCSLADNVTNAVDFYYCYLPISWDVSGFITWKKEIIFHLCRIISFNLRQFNLNWDPKKKKEPRICNNYPIVKIGVVVLSRRCQVLQWKQQKSSTTHD